MKRGTLIIKTSLRLFMKAAKSSVILASNCTSSFKLTEKSKCKSMNEYIKAKIALHLILLHEDYIIRTFL